MIKIILFLLTFSFSSLSSELTAILIQAKAKYNFPAVGALLNQQGSIKEVDVIGYRRSELDIQAADQDKFHLGSCGKSITATLAAILVDGGYLKWEDPLSKLLPNTKMHVGYKNIPFQDLFAHQAGLIKSLPLIDNGDFFKKLIKMNPNMGRKAVTEKALSLKPIVKTPNGHDYSNAGYIIASYIIEQKMGKPFELLLLEKIFRPLDMNSCGFGPVSRKRNKDKPKQPWGHYLDPNSKKLVSHHGDNPPAYQAAGRIHCSLFDWAKYLDMHNKGLNGISKFLKPKTFKHLFTPHPRDTTSFYTYGGWVRLKRGWSKGEVYTHSGSNTLNYAIVWLAPKVNSFLIGTTNRGGIEGAQGLDFIFTDMIRRNIK
jgi:CubicO group peptidase (beta-lactamase class C family)